MRHVRAQFRALSQSDSRAGPGDPDISHSFALCPTPSQTSPPSTPSSQAEGPIPGQAQLLAVLLINDC